MQRYAQHLSTLGAVRPFDYFYRVEGRRMPDRMPRLLEAHRKAANEFVGEATADLWLAGKSMGGRVGCHLSLEVQVRGLICFGYPLVGASGSVRDEVLLNLRAPILFVQGTRDKLCPLDRLDSVRTRMQAETELHVVEGGDHSLLVTKTSLRSRNTTQAYVEASILESVSAFVARHSSPATGREYR